MFLNNIFALMGNLITANGASTIYFSPFNYVLLAAAGFVFTMFM